MRRRDRVVSLKISVIIPTLNEGKYIESTLFHIKQQKPFEIIVADSHSDDDTVKIAKKYGAKIVSCERKNAAVGRNAGAFKAKGDILLFVDADTILFPTVFETMIKDFETGIVGWTCRSCAFSPLWREQTVYNSFNNLLSFLNNRIRKPHSAGIIMAVRKDVFENIGGFDSELKTMEDHDLAKKAGKYGRFKFSNKTCVFTSTRRLHKWGGWKMLKIYSKSYLNYYRKKDYVKAYRPVR
jgi:glycosyltransferase involved in cell wall biosynthesis